MKTYVMDILALGISLPLLKIRLKHLKTYKTKIQWQCHAANAKIKVIT